MKNKKIDLGQGLDEKKVREISKIKKESEWMLQRRLEAWRTYKEMPLPGWGVDLGELAFGQIHYYLKSVAGEVGSWDEVPGEVKETFERMGILQAEREVLAGVKGQVDSEMIYGSLKEYLREKGVIFVSMDEAVKEFPKMVKEHMGTVIPIGDNKLEALNSAVWSGGSFVYVPEGVKVEEPLQVYFRINSERMGQFERTLIVAETGSKLSYYEGCSAPVYSAGALHAGVVEVVVKEEAKVEYVTMQNWYKNVYNLVTKRAVVESEGVMRWLDGNLGSKVTAKYPACVLVGREAKGEMLSIAMGGKGQRIDAGAKMIHLAENTSSQIVAKSISKGGGRTSYRGLVKMGEKARGSKATVRCEGLILDSDSRSDAYPSNDILADEVSLEHEASVNMIDEEQKNYLMSRGISEVRAETMIVNGFLEPVMRKIPLEYALELNKLIEMEVEG